MKVLSPFYPTVWGQHIKWDA